MVLKEMKVKEEEEDAALMEAVQQRRGVGNNENSCVLGGWGSNEGVRLSGHGEKFEIC